MRKGFLRLLQREQVKGDVLQWSGGFSGFWSLALSRDLAFRTYVGLSGLIFIWLLSGAASAQETSDFFRQNCMNCHTVGGGRLTGPDLKGVSERKDREWLIKFMMDPKGVIAGGDPYALKILEESRNVPMPTLPGLNHERAERLLNLIDAESKLPESQFKGLQISTKPFTDADRSLGRELFTGRVRLSAGGTSCISCHSIHGTSALGGGRLGPDLTNVFERLKGRTALSAWLMAPGTETMQPIFRNHPMTADEINALVAYFDVCAGETPIDPTGYRIATLLMGVAGAVGLVFGFDTVWKRRFHSVRRVLVDANGSTPERGTR